MPIGLPLRVPRPLRQSVGASLLPCPPTHPDGRHVSETPAAAAQPPGLWRNADFLRFWTAQGISVFGSQFTELALPLVAVLLLQASDWQFLITTQAARDYAERRVAEHYAEFKRLSEMARTLEDGHALGPEAVETLRRLEREDFVFHDLDPAWAQPPEA